MGDACENTDRELWRGPDEGNGAYYADSIHVTQTGGIGINCGGMVYVRPLRDWHRFAASHDALVKALKLARARVEYLGAACSNAKHFEANASEFLPVIDEALAKAATS